MRVQYGECAHVKTTATGFPVSVMYHGKSISRVCWYFLHKSGSEM